MTMTMKAPCTLSKIIDQMYMKPLLVCIHDLEATVIDIINCRLK